MPAIVQVWGGRRSGGDASAVCDRLPVCGRVEKHQANPCQKCDGHYLEGQGDTVSELIMGITRATIWVIGVITLPTKSP